MKPSLRWQGLRCRGEDGGKRDYGKYTWSVREICWEGCKSAGIVLLFSWFFYRSAGAVFFMIILAAFYLRRRHRDKIKEARKQLVFQFQECILAVSSSLQAGYSVENAFLESRQDMSMMFGEDSFICQELLLIHRSLVMNITLEEALADLGGRSQSEEIQDFAEVFAIAKRNGGNIPAVIRSVEEVIRRRAEMEGEIQAQMAARKLEQKVMNVMPFGILFYVESTSPGYFDPLYHNTAGIIIMSICLAAYLFACGLSEKIMDKSVSVWGRGTQADRR